jgi:hypothetical protein
MTMTADPIARWHDYVDSRDPSRLDAMIAEDAVFMSPAVHRPQQGKALTVKYLTAALTVLGGPDFRYLGEWRAERSAILEFETVLDGIYVNGIDMIGWDETGLITSFKVMVRPLKGLNHVVELMGRTLSQG